MTYKKRFAALGLSLILSLSLFTGCEAEKSLPSLKSEKAQAEIQSEFDAYMEELFKEEVVLNTISLHYTLAEPNNYDLSDYEVSLGSISEESLKESISMLEDIQSSLDDFSYSSLTKEQQLAYDILDRYSSLELDNADLYLYSEVLQPSTGTQAEFPVLLAEYAFRSEQDVKDYLEILNLVPNYFDEIIAFEKEKAKAGLFMSEKNADTVINQCQEFTENPESNFLIETFNNKIESLSNMSAADKEAYRNQNETYVLEKVLPSYEKLGSQISKLKKYSSNKGGLCNYEDGKEYYEYLVECSTGSTADIEDLQKMVQKKRKSDLTKLSKLLSKNPDLATECSTYEMDTSDPSQILSQLKETIKEDFPEAPEANFTVKYVEESLEEYLAPAFYLTSPIDDYKENSIYINASSNYTKMELFTTLAHEGFPGHLYQNVMMNTSDLPEIRHLLNYPGYSEGWATYVEMRSYYYAGLDEDLVSALALNQSLTLSLYATLDMGIHYSGWDVSDAKAFLSDYGISDTETVKEIYEYILGEPANYLKYYVGYLQFLDLKTYAKNALGDDYTDKAFHAAVMKIGPAPFDIIKDYLLDYMKDAS